MNGMMSHRVRLASASLAAMQLLLLVSGRALAQTSYTIQRIVSVGDTAADPPVKLAGGLLAGPLTEDGRILIQTESAAGGEALLQYADGRWIPLVVGGRDAPGGKWPGDVLIPEPPTMNQHGSAVFAASVRINDQTSLGTFLWDAAAQKLSAVALKGMPATDGLVFEDGGFWTPMLNNHGDIAFPALVKDAAGKAASAIFLLTREGRLQPVALPDQALPGGGKLTAAILPTINDAGAVAFLAVPGTRPGLDPIGAYLWEEGRLTRLAEVGMDAPGGKLAPIRRAWVNNKNRSVLVAASLDTQDTGPDALYRFADGALTPLLVRGQEMPGGGKLQTITDAEGAISVPNAAGQHALVARLEGGATAAYLLDADGTLSLILKSGTTTPLGTVKRIGDFWPLRGVGLNARGQVALAVEFESGPTSVILLTPQ